jgi:sugar phosphate isomerase/epimerase
MTMEDCFRDMNDMGATGLEILANGHIEGYPNPTDEWLEWWWSMMETYNITPVEYGHWIDSRRHIGRELTTQESYDMVVRDIRLAGKLGFTIGRTKLGVIDRPGTPEYDTLTPVRNWQEFIKMALPVAEENNFRMCPEIHAPTLLNSKMVAEYVDFIEKNNTKWFGLNIDFGVFQNKPRPTLPGADPSQQRPMMPFSEPEEIVPLLPYVYCCHAKFVNMSGDCDETTTPYKEVIDLLIKHKWNGYLLSEYEGYNKDVPGYASDQLRKQHVMMKHLLGETS